MFVFSSVTGHFSHSVSEISSHTAFVTVKLVKPGVKHIGVEHLLFFRIRNELQFVKAREAIPLEFPLRK